MASPNSIKRCTADRQTFPPEEIILPPVSAQPPPQSTNGLPLSHAPILDGPAHLKGTAMLNHIISYVHRHRGVYLREKSGKASLLISGRRIPIDPNNDSLELKRFCKVVCHSFPGDKIVKNAITQLQVVADEAAKEMSLTTFSCLSEDRKTLYIPVNGRKNELLKIDASGVEVIPNGSGDIWCEPATIDGVAKDALAFEYEPSVDATSALASYESLVVNNYSCPPSLRWLVAMQECFVPFVRDLMMTRLQMNHIGFAGHGKTTAALLNAHLLNLITERTIKTNVSEAYLNNAEDSGLLVLDNQEGEQAERINAYLLSISTGGSAGRSNGDGENRGSGHSRPIVVLTSIEPVATKSEMERRWIEIPFYLTPEEKSSYNPDETMLQVRMNRNLILSAFAQVFKTFFENRGQLMFSTPAKFLDGKNNWQVLCELLVAYGIMTDKSETWAKELIGDWITALDDMEFSRPDDRITDLCKMAKKRVSPGMFKGEVDCLDIETPKPDAPFRYKLGQREGCVILFENPSSLFDAVADIFPGRFIPNGTWGVEKMTTRILISRLGNLKTIDDKRDVVLIKGGANSNIPEDLKKRFTRKNNTGDPVALWFASEVFGG